ncbi:MAG: hypothetical protein M3405_00455 [Acidobacteriota bacterium]|jgi:hypothetical protein|nr:hypothetical protein [Acidobacteriota bacterium]
MYCPNCGRSDQTENTYCRQCGEFLNDFKKKSKNLSFGGETPQEQIRTNLVLSLMSAIVSIASGLYLFVRFSDLGSEFQLVLLTAGFLLAMGGWQLSTFYVGLKLRKTFNKNQIITEVENDIAAKNKLNDLTTNELLPKADFSNDIPISVVENTTRKLKEKIKRLTES